MVHKKSCNRRKKKEKNINDGTQTFWMWKLKLYPLVVWNAKLLFYCHCYFRIISCLKLKSSFQVRGLKTCITRLAAPTICQNIVSCVLYSIWISGFYLQPFLHFKFPFSAVPKLMAFWPPGNKKTADFAKKIITKARYTSRLISLFLIYWYCSVNNHLVCSLLLWERKS